jgi:acyl carrier protein
MDLDFFICFSSVAAVLGSMHLAHYAAANGFLDGLAAYRRGLGLPALTINWGPWQGGGMADGEAGRRTAEAGFKALAPRLALAALGRLLSTDESRVTVVDADWPRLRSLYEARGRQPLLALLPTAGREEGTIAAGSILQALCATAARHRFDFLVGHLQDLVVAVLCFEAGCRPDARQGFFDMGMDSLTAVELKSRVEIQLGLALSRSVVFDYPNIAALAGHLLQRLFPVQGSEPAQPESGVPAVPVTAARLAQERLEIQQLSELQIAALIDAELESLADGG